MSDLCFHFQEADAIADQHRFIDVMGHEDNRLAHRALNADELLLQTLARDPIDRAERLIHQEDRGIGRQRPGEADSLALTPRELVRVAVAIFGGVEADQVEQLVDALFDAFRIPLPQPRHRADVVADGHMRKEAGLLDDVAHLQAERGGVDAMGIDAVDEDASAVGIEEPVDHPQRRGLAAA